MANLELPDTYDHDLVVLLEVIRRIDLRQFVSDLKLNDKETFDRLSKLFKTMEYIR